MEGTEKELSVDSWGPFGDDWDGLESVLAEFALADMAFKSQMLRSLSTFLSCVATTMSYCSEQNFVSARVGGLQVILQPAEILQLHELLDRDLKNLIYFCSAVSWTTAENVDESRESTDGLLSQTLHLEIVSQTVSCCIRILPVLDYVDKRASLSSSKLLDGIFQQVCSPARLFNLLKFGADGTQNSQGSQVDGRSCQEAQHHSEVATRPATDPLLSETFSDSILSEKCRRESCSAESSPTAHHWRQRQEMIFAILEVFLNEFLLHPDLSVRLSRSREDVLCSWTQEKILSSVRQVEALVEAAFVHVLVCLHLHALPEHSKSSKTKGFLTCNLSLPAGLILLEKFSGDDVQPFYVAHIVRFLSRILTDISPLDYGDVEEISRNQGRVLGTYTAGGVDWSYCSRERLSNFDLNDRRLKPEVLHSETTLIFVSSILEYAILLYLRFSCFSNTFKDDSAATLYRQLQSPVLKFWLCKYHPLFDNICEGRMRSEGVDSDEATFPGDHHQYLNNLPGSVLESGSNHSGDANDDIRCPSMASGSCVHPESKCKDVGQNGDSGQSMVLVAALLQLMSSALECIGREVCKLTWLTSDFDRNLPGGQGASVAGSHEAHLDSILHCVGQYLSLCIPSDVRLRFNHDIAQLRRCNDGDLDAQPASRPDAYLHELVGQAIISFANFFHAEVQQGAVDGILEEYFHLLESLVALLLALDERHKIRPSESGCDASGCRSSSGDPKQFSLDKLGTQQLERHPSHDRTRDVFHGNITSKILENMIQSLEGTLHELSKQQRPMPEFLLQFLLKHILKADGLDFVAAVLSNSLKSHLDIQHEISASAEVFRSVGLVQRMIHIVLSEHTRTRSWLSCILYTIDILGDLLPVTSALSLAENTEPVSCYGNIAYILTLGCQFAVNKHELLVKNGKAYLSSCILKLCEGIDRLISEGIAVANWFCERGVTISNLSKKMEVTANQSLGTGQSCDKRSCMHQGCFGQLNGFLNDIDNLRTAVETLATFPQYLPIIELTALLAKSGTFVMALIATDRLHDCMHRGDSLPGNRANSPISVLRSHCEGNSSDSSQGCDLLCSLNVGFEDMSVHVQSPEVVPDLVEDPMVIFTEKIEDGSHHIIEGSSLLSTHFPNANGQVVEDSPEKTSLTTGEQCQSIPNVLETIQDCQMSLVNSKLISKKSLSSKTSAIIKRLLQNRLPSTKASSGARVGKERSPEVLKSIPSTPKATGKGSHERQECESTDKTDGPPSQSPNPFVDFLNKAYPGKDKFEDLRDWIVPKKGRDYTVWLKKRPKVRQRLHAKNFFKRLQEKKYLLLLLKMR